MKEKEKKGLLLSKRMQAAADMVTKGSVLADIGCDHGFVSIYLIQQGICRRVIAMDVNEGPLLRAKEHIKEQALTEYIEPRLSDGMARLEYNEADSVLIAGMGGRLMMRILLAELKKARALQEIILQPQSEWFLLREFLNENGFHILKEDMVEENGKYYPIIKAAWSMERTEELSKVQLWYGPYLLQMQHPILLQYLSNERKKYQDILEKIHNNSKSEKAEKTIPVMERCQLLDTALACFTAVRE